MMKYGRYLSRALDKGRGQLALSILAILPLFSCSIFKGEPPPDLGAPEEVGIVVMTCEVIYDPDWDLRKSIPGQALDRLFSSLLDSKERYSPKAATLVDEAGYSIVGEPVNSSYSRVLVFPAVPAGEYRLASVEAWNLLSTEEQKKIYRCESGEPLDLTDWCPTEIAYAYTTEVVALGIEVKPGDVVYMGKLFVFEDHEPPFGQVQEDVKKQYNVMISERTVYDNHAHSTQESYQLKYDPEHEIDALNEVMEDYKDSPWAASIERRLKELQPAHSGG